MKKIFLTASVLFSLFGSAFSVEKAVPAPFTRGVNFSEWLEFKRPDQVDPNYMTEEDFKNVQLMGCDVVRLPIHFENFCSSDGSYTINPFILDILDKVEEWSTKLKLYVIFDFHNNTAGGTSTDSNIEQVVTAVWQQLSEHFEGKGPYICYEVYNEPHNIDKYKWGKIESNVIKTIRSCDKDRWIVVGGADWNSFDALKALPQWQDSRLIYTFHFYNPMLFTHQGADWAGLERIKGVPFPYAKEKMPALPKNATESERWYLSSGYNYEKLGTVQAVEAFFDQYVEFSKNKNAPVYCGEFGVYQPYAQPEERANWYRIVAKCLDDRGIAHTSWDFYGGFGIFNGSGAKRFPEDLNREVVEAMGLKVPEKGFKKTSWFEKAAETGDYTIYKDGFIKGLKIDYAPGNICLRKQQEDGTVALEINGIKQWQELQINFGEILDFTDLKAEEARLELYAKNSEPDLKISIWFQDSLKNAEQEWRASTTINFRTIPVDGQWHKISIPMTAFYDVGAWDGRQEKWCNSEKLFDWTDIEKFVISNAGKDLTNPLLIKEIKIVK